MTIQPKSCPVNNTSTQRKGLSVIQLLAVLAILGVLVALFLPATRSARPAAYRTQCKNNLKQIGLALHNYHDTYHAFPPAYTVDENGKPLHSWRTLILPFVDQESLYNKLDLSKPWDDPANAEAFKARIPVYQCPSSPADVSPAHTTYMAVVTTNSCLRPTEPRLMSDITDNHGETLMVIEVNHDHAVHWMSPTDADESLILGLGPETKQAHSGGMNAAYVDGSVMFLSAASSSADRLARISIAGGEQVER